MIRAHIVFKGHVQGVYFRDHTKKKADELGVKGWVRNLNNGDVEGVFEGNETKVTELLRYCKEDQPKASVDKAEVDVKDYQGAFRDFRIRWR
ncbi:MAG: acylphosphatase [Thermoplasmata archaeon]|nr:acylphosphatase [Thermoplasmata archaeon]